MTEKIFITDSVYFTRREIQMPKNINQVFIDGCPDLVIDAAFVKKLGQYAQAFANKNDDHIAFFGGTLLGVHPIRFRTEDRNRWFDDILETDDLVLEDNLHRLPAIVSTRHVSGDVMNMSCLWTVHAIYTSPFLSTGEKEAGMSDALMVLQYKIITSIMAHFFPYPADERVAVATYAALSKKFGLKVYGSWRALLLSRVRDILTKSSIHYKTYTEFNNDLAVVYMVNDIHNRIKDIIKNVRDVFAMVAKDPKGLINRTSSTVAIDGEMNVKTLKRNYVVYRRYIHEVVSDRPSFVRDELVQIVSSAMQTMPRPLLEETLQYMSLNYGPSGDKDIALLLDATLTHAVDYILNNSALIGNTNDIGGLVSKFRALYMASRGNDPTLIMMRDTAEAITKRSVRSKNASVIAAVRTGVILYILLRTFTIRYYSK
jgi:hypothetical protein